MITLISLLACIGVYCLFARRNRRMEQLERSLARARRANAIVTELLHHLEEPDPDAPPVAADTLVKVESKRVTLDPYNGFVTIEASCEEEALAILLVAPEFYARPEAAR